MTTVVLRSMHQFRHVVWLPTAPTWCIMLALFKPRLHTSICEVDDALGLRSYNGKKKKHHVILALLTFVFGIDRVKWSLISRPLELGINCLAIW